MRFCIFLLIFFMPLVMGCNKKEKELQKSEIMGTNGQQKVSQSTMTAYSENRMVWKLTTASMYRERTGAEIIVAPVHLVMYDDSGLITTTVVSDSGRTPHDMSRFFIWGGVHIETDDKKTINSRSLSWTSTSRELHSDDYVQIAIPTGEKMRGKGFDAAEDFSWWKFYKDIDGTFPGFTELVGLDDSTAVKDTTKNE